MIKPARKQRQKPDDPFVYNPPPSLETHERAAVTYAIVRDDFFSLPEVAALSPLSFWNDALGSIYAIAIGAHRRGDPVMEHVAARLADGAVDGVDRDYIRRIVKEAGTGYDASFHVAEVLKQARVRRALATAKHLRDEALRGNVDAEHIAGVVEPLVREPKPADDWLSRIVTYRLREDHEPEPPMAPVVVNRIAREGETFNVVASSKVGKSWAVLDLAFSVTTGAAFLSTPDFRCALGNVLLIDNELDPRTTENRICKVQRSGRFTFGGHKRIDFINLRGRLASVVELGELFDRIEPNEYKLVIVDALYRCLPEGTDENSNGDMARIYNLVDRYAMRLNSAFAMIHHSSKGLQSNKSITDVGAGAGSQSRAADAHLVLRSHEDSGVMVLDAANRSFPPMEPQAYRWQFPLWIPAPDVDVTKLKGVQTKQNQTGLNDIDLEGKAAIVVSQIRRRGPLSWSAIRDISGIGKTIVDRVINHLLQQQKISEQAGRKLGSAVYHLREPGEPGESGFPGSTGSSESEPGTGFAPLGATRSGSDTGRPCSVLAAWNDSAPSTEEFPE